LRPSETSSKTTAGLGRGSEAFQDEERQRNAKEKSLSTDMAAFVEVATIEYQPSCEFRELSMITAIRSRVHEQPQRCPDFSSSANKVMA